MESKALVQALKKKFSCQTEAALAKKLGVTPSAVTQWGAREIISVQTIATIIDKALKKAADDSKKAIDDAIDKVTNGIIHEIVEFYEIQRCQSKNGNKNELFNTCKDKSTTYARGLKEKLANSNGIYIFYDSRGHALYVGKAKKQKLWAEMNSALNRYRDVQNIKLIKHPTINVEFRTGYERQRQPTDTNQKLSDLAKYFTAYSVSEIMIDSLEALLVRSFANDLLNVRMEKINKKKMTMPKLAENQN